MLDNLPQPKTPENIATIENTITTKIANVPYYSQSLNCLKEDGEIDRFWFRRVCGLTCAKMAIDCLANTPEKSIVEMAEEGKEKNGYSKNGWIHEYFIELFKKNGLNAYRKEKMEFVAGIKEIAEHIEKGGLVIVSCKIPFLEEVDFHMILIKGVLWENKKKDIPVGFYYSDPDSIYAEDAKERYTKTGVFMNYWRNNMAIFISK